MSVAESDLKSVALSNVYIVESGIGGPECRLVQAHVSSKLRALPGRFCEIGRIGGLPVYRRVERLLGGKGGFGRLMKRKRKASGPVDVSASRDAQGRRIGAQSEEKPEAQVLDLTKVDNETATTVKPKTRDDLGSRNSLAGVLEGIAADRANAVQLALKFRSAKAGNATKSLKLSDDIPS